MEYFGTRKSARFPNMVKQNHRGIDDLNTDDGLREFLNNKLPRKHVKAHLISSIKQKIKSFHLD